MRKALLFTLLVCSTVVLYGHEHQAATNLAKIKCIPAEGQLLNEGWKSQAEDKPGYANPAYENSRWHPIGYKLDLNKLCLLRAKPVDWFRVQLSVYSSLIYQPLVFQASQSFAIDENLNGKFLKLYGAISHKVIEVKAFQPNYAPMDLTFKEPQQVLTIRFLDKIYQPFFYHKTNEIRNGIRIISEI